MDRDRAVIGALLRRLAVDDEVVGTLDFPRRFQWDGYSCGARCVWMIAEHFDLDVSYEEIVHGIGMTEDGSAATTIAGFLRQCGLRAGYHRRMRWAQLERALHRGGVVLADLDGTHWSVVHAVSENWAWVANPSWRQQLGRRMSRAYFCERWTRLGVIVSDRRR
jgi:ABC-type bacteriocin/lantibiotic exporter with double-glycine peptidase domain